MNKKAVFSYPASSAGVVVTAIVVLLAGVSGCGFKSDLTIPDNDTDTSLFKPDVQPQIETSATQPSLPSSAQEAGESGVAVDIATAVASDGQILVSPPDEAAVPEAAVSDATVSEAAVSEAAGFEVAVPEAAAPDAAGVSVDISDVSIELSDLVE